MATREPTLDWANTDRVILHPYPTYALHLLVLWCDSRICLTSLTRTRVGLNLAQRFIFMAQSNPIVIQELHSCRIASCPVLSFPLVTNLQLCGHFFSLQMSRLTMKIVRSCKNIPQSYASFREAFEDIFLKLHRALNLGFRSLKIFRKLFFPPFFASWIGIQLNH